jgi:hypothetical protein
MRALVINFFRGVNKILFLWAFSFILNIITLLVIHYQIKPGEAPLALHYNVLIGVDWYGVGKNLYLIPLVGFAVIAVNYTLYNGTKKIESFIPELCAITSFIVQLCLLGYVMTLLQVN